MRSLFSIFVSGFLAFSIPSQAQELPPPDFEEGLPAEDSPPPPAIEPEVAPDDFLSDPNLPFTGTLADDDPENELLRKDEELFGGEEEAPEGEPPSVTHQLKFEFTSRVQFAEQTKNETGTPTAGPAYLEIEYKTEFETEVNLASGRQNEEIEAEQEISNWGSLARNEFFDCRLEIAVEKLPVQLTSRIQKKEAEEGEEPPKPSLAMKVLFNREMKEDWFSYCTDVSGAQLNTQGAPEDFNLRVLNGVEPSLRAIVVEEFDSSDTTTISLSSGPTTINDSDIANDIILSGEGKITLQPL